MESDTRFYQVLVNSPILAKDVAACKRAATIIGLHTEVIQPGERFINPTTGKGENSPEDRPYVYITGPVGDKKRLVERVSALQRLTEAEAA